MISTILVTVIIIYLILIGSLSIGFDNIETQKLTDIEAKNSFTIIIPFRDEAKNIPSLLKSIAALNYPSKLYEIVFVNDASSDKSDELINDYIKKSLNSKDVLNLKLVNNIRQSKSPKKDAINTAIAVSKNDWLITTDADCVLPKYWLSAFDEFIQQEPVNCIVAPITYSNNTSFFNRFQTLDILSLQAATQGGFGLKRPFLCNGANFAYKKSVFYQLGGFKNNLHIASGDDIFLLEKMRSSDPKKVAYLKSYNAIVTTKPVHNLSQLVHQRLRWASKTTASPNRLTKLMGLIVFLGNLACVSLPLLLISGHLTYRTALSLLTIKIGIDFLLLFKVARFFKQETMLLSYLLSCILYPIFYVMIVFLSFFKSYTWKGRVFKK